MHFIYRCIHGIVVKQCRCISKDKKEIITACPNECKGRTMDTKKTLDLRKLATDLVEGVRSVQQMDDRSADYLVETGLIQVEEWTRRDEREKSKPADTIFPNEIPVVCECGNKDVIGKPMCGSFGCGRLMDVDYGKKP